jgi:uncharacterized protein (TIGR03437 family)
MSQALSTPMALIVLALASPVASFAAAGPTITQILNNSSGTPPGLPNYGIAPSSIFIVTGSDLAAPGVPALQSSAAPGLPSTLNGASITVVVNGVTTYPALYYTSPTQLAAVLPAATPVGAGTLTVTYGGAKASANIQVVASAIGINHFNQIPIPLGVFNPNVDIGVATDAVTGALLTFTNSGVPGEIITLWATGLGADPADSDTTFSSTPHAVNTPLKIYVGGVPATILYQGSAGYPGVTQINLTIPASVNTGCYVSLAAVTGKIISNVVVFPIHPGGGTCVEPGRGTPITGAQILEDVQDTLNAGVLSVLQTNVTSSKGVLTVTNSAGAGFDHETGLLAGATGRSGIITPGGCWVAPTVLGGKLTIAGLDAGSISLTGPAGLAIALPPAGPDAPGGYSATLAAGAIPSSGGTFAFTGTGGADVGPFNAAVTFSNPIFNWTNQGAAATVVREQGLTVTWTSGNPGTIVYIGGGLTVQPSTAKSPGLIVGYGCRSAVEAGQFTVPDYILLGMPAGSGGTTVNNQIDLTFSATGLDPAAGATPLTGQIEFSMPSTYQ